MLLLRNLVHHRRTHLAVILGTAVTAAVLVGSLAMGDVVRHSLLRLAGLRLGHATCAVLSDGRFFADDLAARVQADLRREQPGAIATSVLMLGAVASIPSGERSSPRVRAYGVDEGFFRLAPRSATMPTGDEAALGRRLASRLGVQVGDTVTLRIEKPSWLSRDVPLSSDEKKDTVIRLRATVSAVLDDDQLGRFDLAANQAAPEVAVLPRERLQKAADLAGTGNLILAGGGATAAGLDAALDRCWTVDDVGLQLKALPAGGAELRTPRIFLGDETVVARCAGRAVPVSTYFVKNLLAGERFVPYSMVSAVPLDHFAASGGAAAPLDLADDEVLLNDWTAERLGVKPGDRIELDFWRLGPMRKLEDHRATFTVRAVLPMTGLAAEPSLMPDFPGIAGKTTCTEFDPALPIDFKRITDADNDYWKKHRGTPKAFISLVAAQRIWSTRFGLVTGLRFTAPGDDVETVRADLRGRLRRQDFGLTARDLAGTGRAAALGSNDLGEYFLSFSFFLIAAALTLTALLFGLGLSARRREAGLLAALGWEPRRLRRLLLAEAAAVALLGTIAGSLLGLPYAAGLTAALGGGWWAPAVGGAELVFAANPATVAGGGAAVLVLALLVLWHGLRALAKAQAADLLRGRLGSQTGHRPPSLVLRLATVVLLAAGLGLALAARPDPAHAPFFFGAGACLLGAGLCAVAWWLRRLGSRPPARQRGLGGLALAGIGRAPGRSLAVVAVLASASFLMVAVGAFFKDAAFDAGSRSAGTGGFALVGESSLPVFRDLGTADGRKYYNLARLDAGVRVLPLRAGDGDEASCQNLNHALQPRLWALDSARMAELAPFTFAAVIAGPIDAAAAWRLLATPRQGRIPAIADQAAATYAMKKGLGGTIAYQDESGRPFEVEIVALAQDSILQGGLYVDERLFTQRYPSHSGYTGFLVDLPPGTDLATGERLLEEGLRDAGLDLQPAAERLAALHAVQNVYLSIFQVLGGLGLLLGSLGLGVILLRNTLERRAEFGLLRALGFTRRSLSRLLLAEHALLLLAGLAVGVTAAAVAVLPIVLAPGQPMALGVVGVLLAAVLACGLAAIVIAGRLATGAGLLEALRGE